ncbi:MAG TPA: peptide chain release factor 1 [Candidatus Ornithoclostridium faecavium]|nr:peptide chain release factor 1 [Candidatus Ornithoclostridium faecavium]
MFEKLESMKNRFDELTAKISDPAVIADTATWQKLVKERSALEEPVNLYAEYVANEATVSECREIIDDGSDKEMVALAKEELSAALKKREELTENLKIALLPKDPDDDKNVIIEIRAGAGGDEAGLFGAELVRMYERFAERCRWKVKEIDVNANDLGGIKEAVFMITGHGAYSRLKYESGVHRVQRVPETESQGRIHTSTVTVAVLPEAEDVEVEILEKDLKIDAYRAGGAGGQYVNKTESAIRITHLPTGIVVTCQDEKSQGKNKESAMKVLKSRVYDYYRTQQEKEYASSRKMLVGTGDRSERIRTYNFPQGRVTDHRIGLTLYSLDAFLDGDLFEMLDALALANRNEMLSSGA